MPGDEEFPIGKREHLTNKIPSKLLLCDFHDELRLVIAELREQRHKIGIGNGGAIFFGPTGIGKSWSSMSVLVGELKDSVMNGKSVVYFDAVARRAFVFGETRNVQIESCDYPATKDIPELLKDETVLLYDASRNIQTALPAFSC